jgi:hypothetical protein
MSPGTPFTAPGSKPEPFLRCRPCLLIAARAPRTATSTVVPMVSCSCSCSPSSLLTRLVGREGGAIPGWFLEIGFKARIRAGLVQAFFAGDPPGSSLCCQDHDHLADLMEHLFDRVCGHSIACLLHMQDTFAELPPVIRIGTACSGTDLIMAALETYQRGLSQRSTHVKFEHVFAADIQESCRRFIMLNWAPKVGLRLPCL